MMNLPKTHQQEWEEVYQQDTFSHKNEYPSGEIISVLMGTYGKVENKANINVLDLGCGWGNNLKFLRDKGFSYCGIDYSKCAVEHCSKEHDNIVHGSMEKLPYADNSIDFAYDRGAIQHNSPEQIKHIFAEIYRVLKPGGFLFSMFAEKAEYDQMVTCLNEEEIKHLTQQFSTLQLDYREESSGNRRYIAKTHLILAKK